MWLEYDFDLLLDTLAARLELLLSLAARESLVELLAFRLAFFAEDLLALKDAFSDWLASSDADLLDDLLAAAFRELELLEDLLAAASSELEFEADLLAAASSELEFDADLLAEASNAALAELDLLADRLLSEELLLLDAEFEAELEVFEAVLAVVLLPLVAEPSEADMSCAVVPLEAEVLLPLVPLLLYAVLPVLVAEPSGPEETEFEVLLVFCVALAVPALDAEELSAADFVFDALAFSAEFELRDPFADREALALFEDEAFVESERFALFEEEESVDSEAFAFFEAELVVASEALEFLDEVASVESEEDLLALVVREASCVLL